MLNVREILVSRSIRAARGVGLMVAGIALVGCGQKGALYLPTAPEAKGRATLPQTVRPGFGDGATPAANPASAPAAAASAAATAASGPAR